jgi:hypothetical protein
MSHRVENIDPHHAGDSRLIKLQIRKESTDPQTDFGDPIDISNVNEITYRFSDNETGSTCEFTKTKSGGGISITDGSNGQCEISWDTSDTTGLSGEYFHSCQFTDSSSNVATVFTGTVNIEAGLTC